MPTIGIVPSWTDEEQQEYKARADKTCSICICMKEDGCIKQEDGIKPINQFAHCKHWRHKDALKSFPSAGEYDDEDWYDDEDGETNYNKCLTYCPICKQRHYPFRGKSNTATEYMSGGWRWVGIDHQEPYAIFKAVCPKTKREYKFTIYTPQ